MTGDNPQTTAKPTPTPDYTPEAQAIAERGLHGTDADYDRAIDELIKLGWTDELANYAVLSAGW